MASSHPVNSTPVNSPPGELGLGLITNQGGINRVQLAGGNSAGGEFDRGELALNFIKQEAPKQEFSCAFCEIYKNTFFIEHFRATASFFTQLNLFDSKAKEVKLHLLFNLK